VIGGVSQAAAGYFQPAGVARAGESALRAAGGDTASRAGNGGEETQAAANQNGELTPEQLQQVAELKRRDAEVRAHEAAHQAVGGPYAGSATYEYQRGPDGVNYAVGGEVPIDVSRENEPEQTITKMEQVKAAALAPAEPSGQDRAVAAQADAIKAQAQQELRQSQAEDGGRPGEAQSGEAQPGGERPGGGRTAGAYAVGAYAAADSIGRRNGLGFSFSA
jgi:hypothetical protein